jgi:hypothetical protein
MRLFRYALSLSNCWTIISGVIAKRVCFYSIVVDLLASNLISSGGFKGPGALGSI